jgi:hypothetical protein
MQSVQQQVESTIGSFQRGTIFFPEQFNSVGSDEAVRQALSRICKDGTIIRLSRGVYLYPIIDSEVGILYPSIESVAKAISERDKARIQPAGIYALNRLGLSTQVPRNIIFLTDGMPRKIRVGKYTMTFLRSAPRNFSYKGKVTPLVIAAMKEIGQGKLTAIELQKIKQALSTEEDAVVESDAYSAPRWITDIILNLKRTNA